MEQFEILAAAKSKVDECIGKGKLKKKFTDKTMEYAAPDPLMDDSMSPESFAAMNVIRWVPEVLKNDLF